MDPPLIYSELWGLKIKPMVGSELRDMSRCGSCKDRKLLFPLCLLPVATPGKQYKYLIG